MNIIMITIPIEEGALNCKIILDGNKQLFKKTPNSRLVNILRFVDSTIRNKIFEKNPFFDYRIDPENYKHLFEKEVLTWKPWKKEGISSLKLISVKEKELIWGYIPDSTSFW